MFCLNFLAKKNIIVPHCKLHNDGSIDVSQDGTLLATYVPSMQGFPDNGQICVFSLRKESLGQCIYARSYGLLALVLLFVSFSCLILRKVPWQVCYQNEQI